MRSERIKAGGVAATADKLAHAQAGGWLNSRSIHSDHRGRERRRIKNARTVNERIAKAAARSQRDMAARGGTKKAKAA